MSMDSKQMISPLFPLKVICSACLGFALASTFNGRIMLFYSIGCAVGFVALLLCWKRVVEWGGAWGKVVRGGVIVSPWVLLFSRILVLTLLHR
jgi:hypothetical protein